MRNYDREFEFEAMRFYLQYLKDSDDEESYRTFNKFKMLLIHFVSSNNKLYSNDEN